MPDKTKHQPVTAKVLKTIERLQAESAPPDDRLKALIESIRVKAGGAPGVLVTGRIWSIDRIEAEGWRVVRGVSAYGQSNRYEFWFIASRGGIEHRAEGKTQELAIADLIRKVGVEDPDGT